MWPHNNRTVLNMTPAQLRAKLAKAIAEEAQKKAIKQEELRKKKEQKYVEVGRLLSSLTKGKLGLTKREVREEPVENDKEQPYLLEESVVVNVHSFVSSMKAIFGDLARGTLFANTCGLTGALCEINPKNAMKCQDRLKRAREIRAKEEQREADFHRRMKMYSEEYNTMITAVGKAVCSLTPADLEGEPSRKRKRKGEINGEDVLMNTFRFFKGLKTLMGPHAKKTCFRSEFTLTSAICNVAEKTVRDRGKNEL